MQIIMCFPLLLLSSPLYIDALSPLSRSYKYASKVHNSRRWNAVIANDADGTRKKQLLAAVEYTELGFAEMTAEERDRVSKIADSVIAESPSAAKKLPFGSEWKLLYASAPDFLGLRGGPLSQLSSIGQRLSPDGETLEISLEYAPSDSMAEFLGSPLGAVLGNLLPSPMEVPELERLVQTVTFDCLQPGEGVLELKLSGTNIRGDRFGGTNLVPAPTLNLPPSLAFGLPSWHVLYNDGNLRINRGGDYLGIYRKI